MKKTTLLVVAAAATAMSAKAQTPDSLHVEQLYESVVTAARAPQNAPFAISKISSQDLKEFSSNVQELPYLFTHTPGVVAWGENGLGTGTTYLRIRGAGDSRINVTLDGVPLNSPEDQCVFWANMNSYSSFLSGAEIQRGVGSSTNGDGAFGGTVALTTAAPSYLPSAQIDASYGSYNTWKTGGSFSTGLIGKHWIINGGYHHTGTDGYIHGTAGNSGSWLAGITYVASDRLLIRYHNIGNYEHTGQAWNGVDSGDLLDGTYGAKTGIFGYEDLYRVGLGRYNSLCEYYEQDENGNYTFTQYPQNTTDNFVQDHNILSATWKISDLWTASASLHYTYGEGYYSEFRPDNKLAKFGLIFIMPDGSNLKKSDFVRKKGLTQNTYGIVANAVRRSEKLDLRLGISAQNFDGWHYGYLTYVGNEALRAAILKDGDYMYYDSDATKGDCSAYAKATYALGAGFSAFGDLQYRHVTYRTSGINDKFYYVTERGYVNQELNIDKVYNFVNPKAGLEYINGRHSAFASAALSHREPERNNFTDNGAYDAPVPESLLDYELGYNYTSKSFQAGVTLYYMNYRNQFVQTGEVSDIGEALTTNIANSFRTGVELTFDWKATRWLDVNGDAALSRNQLKGFDEWVEDWDSETGYATFHYESAPLAFSPSAILGGGFSLHHGAARATWRTNYVSRQYLDNTGCDKRSLPGYSTTNINLSYVWEPGCLAIRDVTFGLQFGNIFGSHHACSGWVYSAVCESAGHPNENRYTEIGYIPSAGFTALGTVSIRF